MSILTKIEIIIQNHKYITTKDQHIKKQKGAKKCPYTYFLFVPQQIKTLLEIRDKSKNYKE